MKSIISLVLITAFLSGVLADYDCSEDSYLQYLSDFGKLQRLKSADLRPYVLAFCQSLRNMELKNQQCKCDAYTINKFSDMLESQRTEFLSAKRPIDSSPNKVQMAPKKTMSGLWVATTAPPNWRANNKVSRIKDQGSCGSCWAFTTVGLYESFIMVKGKGQYDLSQQFILECTNTLISNGYISNCAGGYTDFSLQAAQKYGIPEQNAWPYKGGSFGSIASVPSSPGICTTQNLIKYDNLPGVKNVTTVKRYDNITNAQIETLLAEGPVGALMFVDASLQALSGTSVYTGCPAFNNAFAGINHAVVIVGMDANKNYIIKNSWGTNWADSGFATISATNDCALSAFVFAMTWGYQLMKSALLVLVALVSFML